MHERFAKKDMPELFKPFIIRKLIERGIVKTVKSLRKLVDKKRSHHLGILENIQKDIPLRLNRAQHCTRFVNSGISQPKLD